MEAEAAGSPRSRAEAASGRVVMVVERCDEAALTLSRQLSEFGYPVRIVPGLDDLPEAVAQVRPAALIIDQDVAAGRSLPALRAVAGFDCPVLVISDRDDLDSRLATVRAGFDAHMVRSEPATRLAETLDWLRQQNRADPYRADPYRVVIIDDDRFTSQVMALALQRAGFQATVVTEARSVLEVLRAVAPEVLLIDIHMPGCSGIDLAAAIRQMPGFQHVPLLFVTTENSPEHRMLAVRSGGNDFLTKPVPPDLLIATVRARAEWSRQLNATLGRLSESGERFRAVAQTANDAIIATDESGRIIYSNAAAQRAFGCDGRELLDSPVLSLVAPAHRSRLLRLLNRRGQGSGRRTAELEASNRCGGAFPVEVSVSSWRAGGRRYFTGIIRDITERRRAAERLEDARRLADAANAAKSVHISRMAHELRTPLNAVLGYAQLLQRHGPLDERQRACVAHVLSAGEHMLHLTNDALDLALIEAGKLRITPSALDVAVLVGDCLTLTEPEAVRQGLVLRNETEGLRLPPVLADSLRLKQVLLNLLSNAVKYGHKGGTVTLGAELVAGGSHLCLSVADGGPGISPAQAASLFQPFYRLPDTSINVTGTGLGLSICRLLVEAMGGEIGVSSTAGTGSRFWFTVPTAP